MKSKLFLVAMVAASMIACGGNGNVSSTGDTTVSPDSSLGDQNSDNTTADAMSDVVPPDIQTDTPNPPETEESDAMSEEIANPCADYMWLDGMEFYCKDFTPSDCTMEVAPVDDDCGFKCPAFWKGLDQLEINPPPNVKIIVHFEGYSSTCIPTTSQ